MKALEWSRMAVEKNPPKGFSAHHANHVMVIPLDRGSGWCRTRTEPLPNR